jgi:hypothetical protein
VQHYQLPDQWPKSSYPLLAWTKTGKKPMDSIWILHSSSLTITNHCPYSETMHWTSTDGHPCTDQMALSLTGCPCSNQGNKTLGITSCSCTMLWSGGPQSPLPFDLCYFLRFSETAPTRNQWLLLRIHFFPVLKTCCGLGKTSNALSSECNSMPLA